MCLQSGSYFNAMSNETVTNHVCVAGKVVLNNYDSLFKLCTAAAAAVGHMYCTC